MDVDASHNLEYTPCAGSSWLCDNLIRRAYQYVRGRGRYSQFKSIEWGDHDEKNPGNENAKEMLKKLRKK
jgi:hypothetical protein